MWGDEDHREERESSYVTVPTAPRASRWSWGWVGLGGSSGGGTEPGWWLSLKRSCRLSLAVLNLGWYPAGPGAAPSGKAQVRISVDL